MSIRLFFLPRAFLGSEQTGGQAGGPELTNDTSIPHARTAHGASGTLLLPEPAAAGLPGDERETWGDGAVDIARLQSKGGKNRRLRAHTHWSSGPLNSRPLRAADVLARSPGHPNRAWARAHRISSSMSYCTLPKTSGRGGCHQIAGRAAGQMDVEGAGKGNGLLSHSRPQSSDVARYLVATQTMSEETV